MAETRMSQVREKDQCPCGARKLRVRGIIPSDGGSRIELVRCDECKRWFLFLDDELHQL